jgi:hypothetical protein
MTGILDDDRGVPVFAGSEVEAALRARIRSLEAEIAELRATGRMTLLEATRKGLREFGTPPPGEGTHPLQSHRDSMG